MKMKLITIVLLAAGFLAMPPIASAQEKESKMVQDGRAAFNKGDYKTALKLARDAIRSEAPKKELRAEAYGLRGGIYWKENAPDRALKDFEAAIRLNPKRSYWHYAAGRVYYEKRKFEEAAENFTATIERKPGHLVAYDFLVKTYIRMGKPDLANQVATIQENFTKKASSPADVAKAIRLQ